MASFKSEIVAYFSSLIEKETGIQYLAENSHLLENRLRDVAKFNNFVDIDALWNDVQKSGLKPSIKSMVLDLATNNETSFFRDPEVFEFFKNQFVPQFNSQGGSPIKIWSAACSTGQEPYTLALSMAQLRDLGKDKPFQVLATDFSERVLKQAISGTYSQLEIQRGLPAPLLIRFFTQEQQSGSSLPLYRIKPELKQGIQFKQLNLLENWGMMGPFDIVFCRNVLIYQNIENKKKIIAQIARTLRPGGYLIMGGAESLLGLSTEFALKRHGNACTYQLISEPLRKSA